MEGEKRCRVIPRSKTYGIPDLVPFKRILIPTVLILNQNEVRRAMSYGTVYEILSDGTEVLIDEKNFDENYNVNYDDNDVPLPADHEVFEGDHTVIGYGKIGKAGLNRNIVL